MHYQINIAFNCKFALVTLWERTLQQPIHKQMISDWNLEGKKQKNIFKRARERRVEEVQESAGNVV